MFFTASDIGTAAAPVITVQSWLHVDHPAQSPQYRGLGEANYTGCLTEAIAELQKTGEERVKEKARDMNVAIKEEDIEWAKEETAKATGRAAGCIAGQVVGNVVCAAITAGAGAGTISVLCGMAAGELGRLIGGFVGNTLFNAFKKKALADNAQRRWFGERLYHGQRGGVPGDQKQRGEQVFTYHGWARSVSIWEFALELNRLNPYLSMGRQLRQEFIPWVNINYVDKRDDPKIKGSFEPLLAAGDPSVLDWQRYAWPEMDAAFLYAWVIHNSRTGSAAKYAQRQGPNGLVMPPTPPVQGDEFWHPWMDFAHQLSVLYFEFILPFYRDQRNNTRDEYFYPRIDFIRLLEQKHKQAVLALAEINKGLVSPRQAGLHQLEFDRALTQTANDLGDERSELYRNIFLDDAPFGANFLNIDPALAKNAPIWGGAVSSALLLLNALR